MKMSINTIFEVQSFQKHPKRKKKLNIQRDIGSAPLTTGAIELSCKSGCSSTS